MAFFLHKLMEDIAQWPKLMIVLEILIILHVLVFIVICLICSTDSCFNSSKGKFRRKYRELNAQEMKERKNSLSRLEQRKST